MASKEIGLAVSVDRIQHMVMCGDNNVGRNRSWRLIIDRLKVWKS
jgi:hypothetical protein